MARVKLAVESRSPNLIICSFCFTKLNKGCTSTCSLLILTFFVLALFHMKGRGVVRSSLHRKCLSWSFYIFFRAWRSLIFCFLNILDFRCEFWGTLLFMHSLLGLLSLHCFYLTDFRVSRFLIWASLLPIHQVGRNAFIMAISSGRWLDISIRQVNLLILSKVMWRRLREAVFSLSHN